MLNRAVYKPKNSNEVHWSALRVSGVDAADYLHRITTADVKGMQPGVAGEGFILNPQGKIQAYFLISKLSPSEFLLELDAGADGFWLQNLKSQLEYFRFSEKLEIQDVAGECIWLLGEGWKVGGAGVTKHSDSKFGIEWKTHWDNSVDITKYEAKSDSVINWNTLNARRIENGTAWWGIEVLPSSNPLELNLRSGIADQKGCYPGQEVIEKIIAIGSPAKKLCLVVDVNGKKSLKVISKVDAVMGKSVDLVTVEKVW